jgi:hypothetical protein
MNQTFNEFLATSSANIPILSFVLNIIIAALLSVILGWVYIKYGNSLSNRRQFSRNFLLLSMTTMLIITIVKSSLALSLGLVGALSIIRFRAAIKEPEELAYLFLVIAIGLGFGANQTIITIIAFVLIMTILIIAKKYSRNFYDNKNLNLTIQSTSSNKIKIDDIVEILKNNCKVVDLIRFDETEEVMESSFLIEIQDFSQLNKAKNELQAHNDKLHITFIDNKGLFR